MELPQPPATGIDEKTMLEIYIDVRNNDRLLVNTDLYRYTRDNLTAAIDKVYPGLKYDHPDFDMAMKLRNNASRFAGYKTAWQVAELRDVDDTDSINTINKKYNTNYMRSEYEHTVRSTRAAKNWQRFDQDKDLYPYLEYMPSTAGEPRNEHMKLYGVIKALDDPFWDTWLPPADWGCKCSVQQRRSDKGTTQPPEEIKQPPQAMRNNPGKDGQIFTDKHPMIRDVGKKEAKQIDAWIDENDVVLKSWNEFKMYGKEWALINFNPYNGGYNVYHQEHKFNKTKGGIGEKEVGSILMDKHAKQVEFLSEKGIDVKKPDIAFDGKTWDIKTCDDANIETLRKYIREVGKKADNVIFYDAKADRFRDVMDASDRQFGAYKKDGKQSKMPGVYLVNLRNELIKIR